MFFVIVTGVDGERCHFDFPTLEKAKGFAEEIKADLRASLLGISVKTVRICVVLETWENPNNETLYQKD